MSISLEDSVGQLAAKQPGTTRVFARHGIDYCCGGGQPLREVCRKRGLDPERILEEIAEELRGMDEPDVDWNQAPLPDLIRHILVAFHLPLTEELPRLEAMARKVHHVHGAKDPERLSAILSVYLGLKAELDQHMLKEETILFPMIERGAGVVAAAPISVMEHEHEGAAQALQRLRELTRGYQPPAEACTTWRALWQGLADLDESLQRHIHLENNVLFPRALAG